MVSPVLYTRDEFLFLFSFSALSFTYPPIAGSIAFARHQTVIHEIATQCSRIQMEAPQNGVDFFLRVVRVKGERVHDEVEDDQKLVARSRDLLEGAVRVEIVLQHLTGIF